MKHVRQVAAYKRYFLDFYEVQPIKVQKKIEWTLELIRTLKQIPEKYFKHIQGSKGLYEIRVEFESNIYRIFSFFDEGQLIILGNAFQKKTEKTPKKEIEKAMLIMEEYFDEKSE
jgi:phage-related protein